MALVKESQPCPVRRPSPSWLAAGDPARLGRQRAAPSRCRILPGMAATASSRLMKNRQHGFFHNVSCLMHSIRALKSFNSITEHPFIKYEFP
ncbi:Hypothetical predicted protein [Pelobates cultripes]|nr:Hypothetical predicted protein [Pelobates cultripes]